MLINNYFKFTYLLIVYTAMLFFMYQKIAKGTDRVSTLQKSVAMQSLTVAMITGTATVVYPFIQYLPKSSTKYAPLIGQLIWAGSNASTSFIYLTANRTVKRRLGRMLGMAEDTGVERTTNSVGPAYSNGMGDSK
uniref:G_PROTEIN_RECEP_F1_2 domain-containing protein n=1 Tax=Steinernema glaseri TaxID=37863 RepID=A0A1I7YJ65_9BILA